MAAWHQGVNAVGMSKRGTVPQLPLAAGRPVFSCKWDATLMTETVKKTCSKMGPEQKELGKMP